MSIDQPNTAKQEKLSSGGEGSLGITLGIASTGVFYAAVWAFPHPWMFRYFLGHPVCVGATLLFAIASGILLVKSRRVSSELRLAEGLRDPELAPALNHKHSASEQWVLNHDAGRVAKSWLVSLAELPATARRSLLVGRLTELLQRQSGRVSTRHLSDDLREIGGRDADNAHDSLQLVRIIIWAIPMLGFLGTVVGITQTLGNLNFNDGNAAVDQLKIGLYVAFDTTAIGLVLSVIAIFLQYPVELSEQRLLGEIDRRVGSLLFSNLPSDDAADNPAGQIAQLCDGIRVAVGESLASQTVLWRQTIDEAHLHWQRIAEDNGQRIGDAIMQSLAPALRDHAQVVAAQTEVVTDQTITMRDQIRALNVNSDMQREHTHSLNSHTRSYADAQKSAVTELDNRWSQWTALVTDNTRVLAEHQQALIGQLDELVENRDRSENLLQLQSTLDNNLLRIAEASSAAHAALDAQASGGISHAMVTLASAVEILATKIPRESQLSVVVENHETRVRRAA